MADNEGKKICAELGITQKELAKRMGVLDQTISDWATEKNPTPLYATAFFGLLRKERELETLKAYIVGAIKIAEK